MGWCSLDILEGAAAEFPWRRSYENDLKHRQRLPRLDDSTSTDPRGPGFPLIPSHYVWMPVLS